MRVKIKCFRIGGEMVKEVNQVCGKLNKALGIAVTLPNPSSKTLKTAMVCNLVVGAGLVATGIIFSSKWCVALGGIGVISSVVLQKENSNKRT